jgi:hypothetical protein
MDRFDFELTGRTACLFHADDVEAADELKAWRNDPENKKASVAGDDRSPPWTWMSYLYHDGEYLCMPGANIMVALRHAAAKITMKGKTSFKSASQSGLFIPDEFCEFRGPNGRVALADVLKLRDLPFAEQAKAVQPLGFRLFVKRAKVNNKKHVRVRARFDAWSVRGSVEILDPIITPEVLRQMWELAGRYAGLLDWRPSSKESPGPYGIFDAKLKAVKGVRVA